MKKILIILSFTVVTAITFYIAVLKLYDRPHLVGHGQVGVIIDGCDRFDVEHKRCTSLLCEKDIYNNNLVPRESRPVKYSSRYDVSKSNGMIVHFIEYSNGDRKDEKYFTICVLENGNIKKLELIEEADFGSASLYIK